ncbi:hypothetical protein AGMMS49545_15050 [Betaproteobacteria bacterium]|nr:hypothetical protein AGMMS49545_15050 [Betaproteobacteria bacterium]GHU46129.1 hypothetical protein AGMMS50289_18800 [Betaproteobacteria bacterium]
MTHEIHTTWGEFRHAFGQILRLSKQSLCIFDDDLTQLGLQSAEAAELVQRMLTRNPVASVRIALRRIDRLHETHPRLVQLVVSQSHRIKIAQIPSNLQPLRDTLVVSDNEHALVRFDLEHARHKFILADEPEVVPYAQRFNEIWANPGTPFQPTAMGL